jgi:hypothetical protein
MSIRIGWVRLLSSLVENETRLRKALIFKGSGHGSRNIMTSLTTDFFPNRVQDTRKRIDDVT